MFSEACICRLVFLWLALPWLQAELDSFKYQLNHTARRADKNKVLPHGIPVLITEKPQNYNSDCFKVSEKLSRSLCLAHSRHCTKVLVPDELFDEMKQRWAPLNHPVFNITLSIFDRKAQELYTALGSSDVSSDSF